MTDLIAYHGSAELKSFILDRLAEHCDVEEIVTRAITDLVDEITRLRAALAEAEKKRDEAIAKYNDSDGEMRDAALHAIRELLTRNGVPAAAFIDDHVANAIVQRNAAQSSLAPMREALEEVSAPFTISRFNLDQPAPPLDYEALAREFNRRQIVAKSALASARAAGMGGADAAD